MPLVSEFYWWDSWLKLAAMAPFGEKQQRVSESRIRMTEACDQFGEMARGVEDSCD